jgi:uncharacterized damage-inducible protein DinB
MSISASMLPELEQELAATRKCLERLPVAQFGWQPHEKSRSLGALATHLAYIVGWGATTCTQDSLDFMLGGQSYREQPAATTADLLARFDENAVAFKTALAAVSDERMMATWSLRGNGQVMFSMPRVATLRGMIFNHLAHHRGQLVVYMRLTGVAVPSIYGPSADEPGNL